MDDDASRLRFIETLAGMSADSRQHLLAIEEEPELREIFRCALANGYGDVASFAEVEANNRLPYSNE